MDRYDGAVAEADEDPAEEETPAKLFGDPHSQLIERGPERRAIESAPNGDPAGRGRPLEDNGRRRPSEPGHVLRSGRGDSVATGLIVLAVLVFGSTVIAGTLILYNAKTIGAFSNPWDSTRVAIGVSVLAVGLVQSAILVGVSRVISYLLGTIRVRERELEASAQRSLSADVPDR